MSSYDSFFRSRGKGCPLLAIKKDIARGRDVSIFYIGEDNHVGVNDGGEVWIAPLDYSMFFAFNKNELRELIEKVKAGETIPVSAPRKQLLFPMEHLKAALDTQPTTTRKKLNVKL